MTILDYLQGLGDELQDTMITALNDYHSHEDYVSIAPWDKVVAGYMAKPKDSDSTDAADTSDDAKLIEGLKQDRYVKRFFSKHSIIPLRSEETDKQYIYYVECPWKENHTSEESETATFISIDKRTGIINFFCHHDHCNDKQWQDFKSYYKDRDGEPEKDTPAAESRKKYEVNLVSGRELQKKDLPPIQYAVERMIPEGYSIMSAPFKYGKSWFSLELCLAVAAGDPFLGMQTMKGAAVYIALEDCDKFAQDRLNMVLDGREAPEGFYYIYDNVPTLDDGFIDYLNDMADIIKNSDQDLRLVVIDILAKVEYQAKRGETAYKCDYRTGGALKQWADDHQISVVAITHTTKTIHPDDVFMNTTGTNGVTGAADAIITIAKESRTVKEGILAITGRRVIESYHQVFLNGFIWENLGEVDPETMQIDKKKRELEAKKKAYLESNIRKAIIKIADKYSGEELRARNIIDYARDMNIFILESAKDVGGFIHDNQNLIITEDGIKASILKHGNASASYRFTVWEKITVDEVTFFGDDNDDITEEIVGNGKRIIEEW